MILTKTSNWRFSNIGLLSVLFGGLECPKCGREKTIGTDGLEDYWICKPCNAKYHQEQREKEEMNNRLQSLEEEVKRLREEKSGD